MHKIRGGNVREGKKNDIVRSNHRNLLHYSTNIRYSVVALLQHTTLDDAYHATFAAHPCPTSSYPGIDYRQIVSETLKEGELHSVDAELTLLGWQSST